MCFTTGLRPSAYYFDWWGQKKSSPQFSLLLAKPDGTAPIDVLKDIEHVVSRRISGDVVHFIYQKGLEIKESKISLKSFEVQSDSLVAKMLEVAR